MSDPFTLEDWNALIGRVNELGSAADGNCAPLYELSEVEAPHIWSKKDIQDVRNRLLEICHLNDFPTTLDMWEKSIIDEIETAIGVGWCGCEPVEPTLWWSAPGRAAIASYINDGADCGSSDSKCPGFNAVRAMKVALDIMPEGTKIAPEGLTGRTWFLSGTVTYWNGDLEALEGPSGTINGKGEAHVTTSPTMSYWAEYFQTIQYCQCVFDWASETHIPEMLEPLPSETKLEYWLHIGPGDGTCGGPMEAPC